MFTIETTVEIDHNGDGEDFDTYEVKFYCAKDGWNYEPLQVWIKDDGKWRIASHCNEEDFKIILQIDELVNDDKGQAWCHMEWVEYDQEEKEYAADLKREE